MTTPPFSLIQQDAVTTAPLKDRVQKFFEELQDKLITSLETIDRKERFREDRWQHHEGGGGKSRILQEGDIFEKAGVNTSAVTGTLSEPLAERLNVKPQKFFAGGISVVLHPYSPMIPTVHMNLRYLQLANDESWFGGGSDLTPYYFFREDVLHFHKIWKTVCDKHNPEFYSRFKQWCDEYFYIKHRNEMRGVGGIFFDYIRTDLEKFFFFVQDVGNAFREAYVPIIERRRSEPWSEQEKQWQLIRRGRYAEFNLVYDRGTLFGLETQGRTESILMSLPPTVKWVYSYQPKPGSHEEELLKHLKPYDWLKE